ncbi:hypothetical protein TRFO_29926 [Tritrichomonas foetus]|uniref:Uncharacterized protein n=1 Tax=Tritrichomonas foetus TaxID=1144522 RepID=A0A1J4JWH7_9EUKA|nr:hypothetical protein TRFO_29926 [Tritrichomonas foetus]|eukprot:OHT02800.1 hypothetical protein TRFO_29926 [Tritrichomonas foetus]
MSKNPKKEQMPSPDINPGNAIQRIEECLKYMTLQQWSKFNYLYPKLQNFQDIRVKGAGKMLRDDDEFTCAWNNLRACSVVSILKNLESATNYDDFLNWLQKLSEIVTDQRCLWNILHTEVQPSLKVTLEQSRQIAAQFFTPEMLFEFGLDSFLASGLCDFTNLSDEDELIDIFYATAGYMRACNLPSDYEVKANKFVEFVSRILIMFSTIPDFDAHRFVWLVEAIHDNLHVSSATLRTICENVLKEYAGKDFGSQALSRLHKMCIISTSPFLQQLSMLQTSINTVFKRVIEEQHKFVNKYIFGCYVNSLWDENIEKGVSEPLTAWSLFVKNLAFRIKEKPELPNMLLIDLIDDSLTYFTGYYGEVQPSKERSIDLRRDIFVIAQVIKDFYPGKIIEDTLRKCWFLLYIAAVAGADEELLKNVKHMNSQTDEPFLGLEHDDKDFADYKLALGRLSMKFESEFEAFEAMCDFIRKGYNGKVPDSDEGEDDKE